jgi:hypothetical protein
VVKSVSSRGLGRLDSGRLRDWLEVYLTRGEFVE